MNSKTYIIIIFRTSGDGDDPITEIDVVVVDT
jgi:hypothetical protein